MKTDLNQSREELNQIDRQIAELFDARMRVTPDIAQYKLASGKPIYDPEREKQVIRRVQDMFPQRSEEFREELATLFHTLMDLSKEQQKREIGQNQTASAAYYGVPGSFTHEAMESFFGSGLRTRNYLSCEDIFRSVAEGKVQYGVVPIENSTTGIISDVFDCLSRYPLYIVREGVLLITQNLLGIPGATTDGIREVYSHAQGFAQAERYFAAHPEWNRVPFYNTAKSAQHVAELKDPSKACVASLHAASVYGLEVLARGIQDNPENYTRFIAVSRNMEVSPDADRISIYLKLKHEPGALHRVLGEFAGSHVNLLKVESRPIPGHIWEYSYFVDLAGNVGDEAVVRALQAAKPLCLDWKLLGNYKSRVTE